MPASEARFRAFLAALEGCHLDGFLVSRPANLNYLFNFSGSAGLALCRGGEARLIVDSRYIEQASLSAVNCHPLLAETSLQTTLRDMLPTRGGKARQLQIGLESKHLTFQAVQKMKSWRRRVRWVPQQGLIEKLRIIKDREEVRVLGKAFRIAQQAFKSFRPTLRPGMTESQVAGMLEFELRRHGGQGLAFETIVASGARSSLPHATASHRKIPKTKPVLIDFGVRYRGYCSDLTRMHQFPGSKIPEIYEVVREAQQAALDVVRPGIAAGEVDAAARQLITRHGYGDFFGHSTGHGLGLEVHELPRISASGKAILKPGMVFTIEPGIYLPGRYGVRIEDAILVTPKGYRPLSTPGR